MNGTELRSFSQFQILTKIACSDCSRNLENFLILKFVFIHCKTVKVSQKNQIWYETWFTFVFLMNGTELRCFSHFQILTKIEYSDLSRNLENWLNLKFTFFDCKTTKSQSKCSNSIVNMIYTCFLEEEVLVILKYFTKIAYQDLSRKLQDWPILKFTFFDCKTLISQ